MLRLICYTSTTLSAGCPTSVDITVIPDVMPYELGHVLSCNADGYNPVYAWTGTVNSVDIGSPTGNTYTLAEEGDFDLTCTVTINGDLMCTVTTDMITGTALGNCQLRHSSLLIKY